MDGKKWNIDWDTRMIYLNKVLSNKELVELFVYLTDEEKDRMIEDGPLAEWNIIVVSEIN